MGITHDVDDVIKHTRGYVCRGEGIKGLHRHAGKVGCKHSPHEDWEILKPIGLCGFGAKDLQLHSMVFGVFFVCRSQLTKAMTWA